MTKNETEQKIKTLEKQVAKLQEEIEILKRAVAYPPYEPYQPPYTPPYNPYPYQPTIWCITT